MRPASQREGHRFESVILHKDKLSACLFHFKTILAMYFVYILFSSKSGKYYIGSTDNLESRLKHHNAGATPSTKSGAPHWELKYSEPLADRTSALKREIEIKRKKSKRYIEWLIRSSS